MKAKATLDGQTAGQVIESAVRTQAQLVIESASLSHGALNGFLISGDDKALLMEITGRPAHDSTRLVGVACQVQLFSDQRYCFASTITAAPHWGETRSLAIARPAVLTVLDRRRFVRAHLAPSSKVTIQWQGGGSSHRQVATLLNICSDGLACRLGDSAADAFCAGENLQASFELPFGTFTFDMPVAVSNKTPASKGFTIVGMQFVRTSNSAKQLGELREALAESERTPVETGALLA